MWPAKKTDKCEKTVEDGKAKSHTEICLQYIRHSSSNLAKVLDFMKKRLFYLTASGGQRGRAGCCASDGPSSAGASAVTQRRARNVEQSAKESESTQTRKTEHRATKARSNLLLLLMLLRDELLAENMRSVRRSADTDTEGRRLRRRRGRHVTRETAKNQGRVSENSAKRNTVSSQKTLFAR